MNGSVLFGRLFTGIYIFCGAVKPVFMGHLSITEKLSLHDSSLVLEHGEDRTPFWDYVPWSEGVLSLECPLRTGFTVFEISWHVLSSLCSYWPSNVCGDVNRRGWYSWWWRWPARNYGRSDIYPNVYLCVWLSLQNPARLRRGK